MEGGLQELHSIGQVVTVPSVYLVLVLRCCYVASVALGILLPHAPLHGVGKQHYAETRDDHAQIAKM